MNKPFREEFKFYKRKDVPLNLEKVIDLNNVKTSDSAYGKLVKSVICSRSTENWAKNFGMKDPSDWEVFEFLNKPGLIFIKNPFLESSQRYWIVRCLQDFTKKPNKLNIDAHNIINSNDEWWDLCQRHCGTEYGTTLLEKLRWATFGYHHNWDTKEYSESSKSDFPSDLKILCKFIAEALNFPDFSAEAAIINMYHFGSSLSGHTDHSEINVEAPLLSFSFGQPAVFLIGGTSLDDEALPILLESGDIIVMSGESRLCYHGVPRIVPTQKEPWKIEGKKFFENCGSEYFSKEVTEKLSNEQFWKPFEQYVNKSRINMNVRQVLHPGQMTLDSTK